MFKKTTPVHMLISEQIKDVEEALITFENFMRAAVIPETPNEMSTVSKTSTLAFSSASRWHGSALLPWRVCLPIWWLSARRAILHKTIENGFRACLDARKPFFYSARTYFSGVGSLKN